jgi:hypothetical protein
VELGVPGALAKPMTGSESTKVLGGESPKRGSKGIVTEAELGPILVKDAKAATIIMAVCAQPIL